ncbi:hypothetical protein NDU88_010077 [Pleurodeles waltl]|uniref:Uncharacterized protein n=1 Tax=Pleurodeles waltl TaxID=8319 RepID=A0AAV7PUX5_PLEWA|nr:hypothetical protein NDU88_010077 [Pleurodeles waltl]
MRGHLAQPSARVLTRVGPGPPPDASSGRSPGLQVGERHHASPSAGRQAREIRPRQLTQRSGIRLLLTSPGLRSPRCQFHTPTVPGEDLCQQI